ncbi:hypothetical protein LOC71_00855 [Rhodopirellula sp. JC740]|uniref:Uncharacterized protein n=1 Tax=Rhodopirellula halodulae TaxID=2894198 RepID=A0ABS8ND00_9BACT|nr:hypothetical protein [Rhodopirellula sp. JC740]MCC9640807.1 hypothetical protein [Rhodopirellula sp. JC740]
MTSLPTTSGDQPAFGCVVYIRRNEAGRLCGRVANLDGLETEGASERDILAALVKATRAKISSYLDEDQPVPWIDPPKAKADDETKRFLPLHL